MHIVTLNVQEEDAARAWDHVAIAIGRPDAHLNFDINTYADELDKLKSLSINEAIAMCLKSSVSHGGRKLRGQSGYRGVTKTLSGRWMAEIGYGFVYVYTMKECSCFCIYIYYLYGWKQKVYQIYIDFLHH